MKTRLKPGDKVFYFDGHWHSMREVTITKVVPSCNKPYDENPKFDCCYFDDEDPVDGKIEILTMRYFLYDDKSELISAVNTSITELNLKIIGYFGESIIDDKISTRISRAIPGDSVWDTLTAWAEANNYVQSKVPLDERRYG